MKKKYLKNTYLLGVSDYDMKWVKDEKLGAYITVKYIKDIDEPYIETHSGKNACLLADGYYIIEYLPLGENYAVRVFMNDKKEPLEYYIDITKENGYDNEEKSPFYLDLYLDITISVNNDNMVRVWDENEIEEAVRSKDITEEDYDLAYKTLRRILDEIKDNKNVYINCNHGEVIDKVLGNN